MDTIVSLDWFLEVEALFGDEGVGVEEWGDCEKGEEVGFEVWDYFGL